MALLLELARLGIVGIVAAVFTSFVANRDFRAQRWWERRADAYVRVIEALSDMLEYFSQLTDAEIAGRKLTDEREAELHGLWKKGELEIRRATDAGSFLFSADVAGALAKLRTAESNVDNSYFEYLDSRWGALRDCLETVVASSRTDLAVPKPLELGLFRRSQG